MSMSISDSYNNNECTYLIIVVLLYCEDCQTAYFKICYVNIHHNL